MGFKIHVYKHEANICDYKMSNILINDTFKNFYNTVCLKYVTNIRDCKYDYLQDK